MSTVGALSAVDEAAKKVATEILSAADEQSAGALLLAIDRGLRSLGDRDAPTVIVALLSAAILQAKRSMGATDNEAVLVLTGMLLVRFTSLPKKGEP